MDPLQPVTSALAALSLSPRDRVGVACSGGRDSSLLLEAAAARWGSPDGRLRAVHVNHGLRGADGDGDAALVRRAARRLGLPCSVLHATIEPGAGLEARAREARYAAFRSAARRHGLTVLLLAHHEDDQAETVVMRVLRDAGPRGLRGMPRERLLSEGCRLVRPFLHLRGEVIARAAEACRLRWREDASNRDRRHLRNRVRHDLLPAMEHGHEQALRITRAAHRSLEALESAASLMAPEVVRLSTRTLAALHVPRLRSLPPPLAFHVVDDASPLPLSAAAFRALQGVLRHGERTTIEGPLDVTIAGDTLWLASRARPARPQGLASPGQVHVAALDWQVSARGRTGARLAVRPWRPGDRIDRRSVTSILNKMGVPPTVRAHYPVLTAAERPVWVVDGRFRRADLEVQAPSWSAVSAQ